MHPARQCPCVVVPCEKKQLYIQPMHPMRANCQHDLLVNALLPPSLYLLRTLTHTFHLLTVDMEYPLVWCLATFSLLCIFGLPLDHDPHMAPCRLANKRFSHSNNNRVVPMFPAPLQCTMSMAPRCLGHKGLAPTSRVLVVTLQAVPRLDPLAFEITSLMHHC